MWNVNTQLSLFQVEFSRNVSSQIGYMSCQNTSCFVCSKASLQNIFSTFKQLFVRNYTIFMTFREQINEFDYSMRMLASIFIQQSFRARKYQSFDVAHASTLLSYLSNVIKGFIQLAQVIIGVHFLQRQNFVERQYTIFFSWRISYYEMNCSTDNLMGEHHYSFYVVCRNSCFEYT